jgi:phage repressor protein C with HTH and peptisase S24 domain
LTKVSNMGMNDNFAERLRHAISNAGSIQKLGELAEVAPRTISGYLVGKGDPSRQRLIALADAGQVSVEWLATGRGDPTPHYQAMARDHSVVESDGGSDFALVPPLAMDGSSSWQREQDLQGKEASIAIRADLLHAIGLDASDVRMLTARGDSMAPTINEGDRVVIDTTAHTMQEDAIYVLRVDGGVMFRRLQRDLHGGVWVITDAQHYQDEHLPEFDTRSLNIVGRPILRLTQQM